MTKDIEQGIRYHLDRQSVFRKACQKNIRGLSHEQLCVIPPGFRNSLAWNLIHMAAVQQDLVYLRSGLEAYLPFSLIEKYAKGSFPGSDIKDDLQLILPLFEILIDDTLVDFQKERFVNYESYTTAMGGVLKSVEDAVAFITLHEGIHFGYMLAQRRALGI